jgi:hypothetical protein
MSEEYDFELIFALPEGEHGAEAMSDAVFEAGFEDALVGTGLSGLLGVELTVEGEDGETVILQAARTLIAHLPVGTKLHEVRPDLVSLSDVAERLSVKRQALAQREMPKPVSGGLFRITEISLALENLMATGKRKSRFDYDSARPWFRAGKSTSRINSKIATHEIEVVNQPNGEVA